MKHTEKVMIHNKFDIEVIDAKTGKVKQKAQAFNTILNSLWSRLLVNENTAYDGTMLGGEYSRYTFYGSGSGTPSASDTSLFHHEGVVENMLSDIGQDSDSRYAWAQKYIQLSETQAVGVTLTEVGIGYGTSANNLCTHAMLQDMNGNPISIQKTNTDIINIYATIYIHWSQDSFLVNMTVDRGNYLSPKLWLFGLKKPSSNTYWASGYWKLYYGKECLMRRDTSYDIDASGYVMVEKTITNDVANKKAVWTLSRLGVNDGNIGGGLGFMFLEHDGNGEDAVFDLPTLLGGTNITSEAVGTGDGQTTEFALKFDYPENVVIYKNGTRMTSGYTVRKIPVANNSNVMGFAGHLRPILGSSTPSNIKPAGWRVVQSGPRQVGLLCTSKTSDNEYILYNRAYEIGISQVSTGWVFPVKVYTSDDMENWTLVAEINTNNQTVQIPSANQHAKFIKAIGRRSQQSGGEDCFYLTLNSDSGKALVFDTAPANGDVITVDYHTPYIAKDSDHVFDLTITWQFGEYVE